METLLQIGLIFTGALTLLFVAFATTALVHVFRALKVPSEAACWKITKQALFLACLLGILAMGVVFAYIALAELGAGANFGWAPAPVHFQAIALIVATVMAIAVSALVGDVFVASHDESDDIFTTILLAFSLLALWGLSAMYQAVLQGLWFLVPPGIFLLVIAGFCIGKPKGFLEKAKALLSPGSHPAPAQKNLP